MTAEPTRYYCTNRTKPCPMLNRDVHDSVCRACGEPTTQAKPMPKDWFEKYQRQVEASHDRN